MPRVAPVPVVEASLVAGLPRPFSACARCGYLGVRTLTEADGGVAGSGDLLTAMVCPRCGHEGPPVLFDAPEEYARFLRGLHEAR